MLARINPCIGLLVCTTVLMCGLAIDANPAFAKSCVRSGDRVISRTSEMTFISRTKARTGWKKGPSAIFACSFKYGKRVHLMDAGVKDELFRSFGLHEGNSRYAAFVTSFLFLDVSDYDPDGYVQVRDLRSGKRTTFTPPLSTTGGGAVPFVTALALNKRGWVGWISDAWDWDLSRGSWETEVHLRDSGKARVVASGDDIEWNFLRFDGFGENLVWTTSTTSAPAH